jgi:hypothetical protein
MTLGNMRHLGVQGLIASCPNPPCRNEGPIDVSKFADDVELPSFASKVVCAKCGSRGNKIDVRPNWEKQPSLPTVLQHDRIAIYDDSALEKEADRELAEVTRA